MIVLKDDKNLFLPYQGAPLTREETLRKFPELKILNELADRINTEEMSRMNYAVRVQNRVASEVAREYLKKNKLID